MAYTTVVPTLDTDHVKDNGVFDGTTFTYNAFDTTYSLTGSLYGYIGPNVASASNQRINVDLGSGVIIRRIRIDGLHFSGAFVVRCAKNFTFWGSNSATAFAETTYGTDTDWTQITTNPTIIQKHVEADQADPQYFTVTNTTSYQYYSIKMPDQWSDVYYGLRRIELQTEDGYSPGGGGGITIIRRRPI